MRKWSRNSDMCKMKSCTQRLLTTKSSDFDSLTAMRLPLSMSLHVASKRNFTDSSTSIFPFLQPKLPKQPNRLASFCFCIVYSCDVEDICISIVECLKLQIRPFLLNVVLARLDDVVPFCRCSAKTTTPSPSATAAAWIAEPKRLRGLSRMSIWAQAPSAPRQTRLLTRTACWKACNREQGRSRRRHTSCTCWTIISAVLSNRSTSHFYMCVAFHYYCPLEIFLCWPRGNKVL